MFYPHTHFTYTGSQETWSSWKHYLFQTDAEPADESFFNEVCGVLGGEEGDEAVGHVPLHDTFAILS